MNYKSVDELENFSFEDCVISRLETGAELIELELEALIVKAANSQNTNYTESYAGTARMRLLAGKILSACKEGYRYLNADDELIRQVPDETLSKEELSQLLKDCPGAYLFAVRAQEAEAPKQRYELCIEFTEADGTMADSYLLQVECEKAVVEWDRYMNRVQRG